jgi:hypothetical protein
MLVPMLELTAPTDAVNAWIEGLSIGRQLYTAR